MRRPLIAAVFLVPLAGFAALQAGLFSAAAPAAAEAQLPLALARACDGRCSAQWMDANLRLDQLTLVGTAESYKQKPDGALVRLVRMGGGKADAEALDFGQPSIPAQLDADVRALSFDVAYDPKGGLYKNPAAANMAMTLVPDAYVAQMEKPGFKTIHVLDVDYASSCPAFADCLKQVADWSAAHPRHLPIVITLHTNDARTPMPGATKPVACDQAALDALDAEIRAVVPAAQLITPDMVQGKFPSLRDAALAHAWPRLGGARGKLIFVLDDSADKARAYQGGRKSLEGRAMFLATDEASPAAGFVAIADPVKERARIEAAVKAGFLVVTRADADTREARKGDMSRRDAAFASGAQVVLTDFAVADPAIGSYRVSLADDARAMCGARLAPERCVRFADQPLRTATAAMP